MTRILIAAAVGALAASASSASAQAVTVTVSEWKVELARDTVKAGPVTFRVTNAGSMNHAFYVRGEGLDRGTKEIPTKQSATLTVTLKPGAYEVFCPMSDESHKMAGMKASVVVVPGDAPAPPKKPNA